jgi:hypothetical protein
MKDIKLIDAIVVTYFHENKDKIDEDRLKEILTDSLNIDIGSVKLEGGLLKVYYGPKTKRKKVLFEIHDDKIKHRKE